MESADGARGGNSSIFEVETAVLVGSGLDPLGRAGRWVRRSVRKSPLKGKCELVLQSGEEGG